MRLSKRFDSVLVSSLLVFFFMGTSSGCGTLFCGGELTIHEAIADRGYVLQTGQIVLSDTAEGLLNNPQMRQAYLGEV